MAALWCGVEWDTALRRDAPFCRGCEGVWCCDYFSHWRREPAVGLEAQEKGPFGGMMVSWKFVILFVMFEFSCMLEMFTMKKNGSGRKTLISSTA